MRNQAEVMSMVYNMIKKLAGKPEMQLILITCCNLKQTGGQPLSAPETKLKGMVSDTTLAGLLKSRRELARLTNHPPGPDLGDPTASSPLLLPAYQRYDGVMYQAAAVRNLYPKARSHCRLLIVSALYGIVDGNDPIRDYNLMMQSSLPGRQRVLSFWKQHGLGKLLQEYVDALKPAVVHDLLTANYRMALEPWLTKLPNRRPYNFPGLGMGALHARGHILRNLLAENAA
jgi:hypothetical protein